MDLYLMFLAERVPVGTPGLTPDLAELYRAHTEQRHERDEAEDRWFAEREEEHWAELMAGDEVVVEPTAWAPGGEEAA